LYAERQVNAMEGKQMEVISVRAPSKAHAQRLIAALHPRVSASLDGDDTTVDVALLLDAEAATRLIDLFDVLGGWLNDGGLAAAQVGFGERMYTLFSPNDGQPSDPTAFLLERTIQLQVALDSRVVLEQAKGIVAEREAVSLEEAFDRIRRQARRSRAKIAEVAATIVATVPPHRPT
jgi:ANTAR domain